MSVFCPLDVSRKRLTLTERGDRECESHFRLHPLYNVNVYMFGILLNTSANDRTVALCYNYISLQGSVTYLKCTRNINYD